jgi:hypothetical protein
MAADHVMAGSTSCRTTPRWRDNIVFNEYFHGENGAGLGAAHQTGWTGLVADLICRPDPFGTDPLGWGQS